MRARKCAATAAVVCAFMGLAACESTMAPANSFAVPPPPRAVFAAPVAPGTATLTANYVVRSGDTLSEIAQRFGAETIQLARMNGIAPPYSIRPGQTLILPGALTVAANLPPPNLQTIQGQIESLSRSSVPGLPYAPAPERQVPAAAAGTAPSPAAPPPPAVARAAPVATLPAPPPRASSMVWPVRGTVASTFGSKGGGIANDGIDIRAAAGLPVVAVDNGVVAYAGNELKALGNLVLIQHTGNWVSAYANTGAITVQKGQTVTRGQQVATTGQTGNSKTTGLHFELRRGTQAVDPMQHLPPTGNGQVAAR